MGYHISILKDENRLPELIALFQTGLGETTAAHWKWRLFTENGQEDQPFAVVIDDDNGKMVAVSSVLPIPYINGGEKYRCFQFCDWVVHPDCRGQGLIKQLYQFTYRYFQEKNYDFIMEFPNANSYPIFMKYGFHEEPSIPCWKTGMHLFFYTRKPNYNDIVWNDKTIRFSSECPLEQQEFFTDGRSYRNTAYLKWKYDRNPDTVYRWLSVWNGNLCIGYFVYTVAHGRLRTAVNVYDWELSDADELLFRKIISLLHREGNYVSIWGRYPEPLFSFMKSSGLSETDDGTRLVLNAVSGKGWPEILTLTRIDTDY